MDEDYRRKLYEMDDIDERTIENKPWARRLLTHSLEITRKAVLNWCNIVTKIGESELDVDNYVSIFIQQIETLYEDLIVDVDTIQEKSLDKIMKLLQQMQNLCRDLQIEIPTFNYEEVPLTELRKMLLHRIEEYESLAEIRRKELRELHQKELKLCKSLGREPKFLSESPLPPPSDVEDLRALVESLENEVLEREEKFFQLKEQIVGIVEELQVPASLDFEKEILSLANTEVRIMDSDMEQLQLYHDRLVKQSESVKEEISELRAKVDGLWDKLETDIGERDVFRKNNTGNSLNALNALKQEVERLEEMKKANIKVFINKQRQELSEIWEKCHCTEEDTNMFTFYYSECYSEDLFELHEREIQKWKAYYEENKELFELLQEHDRLWNELCKLESNSGTANRYKNRGGQLLIEEKLRNKLTKRIPKIEESLTKLSDAFLMRKGKRFLTFGKTIEEYIVKLHEDRDKEFKLKLSAKKQQREQVSTVGRSRMNLFPPSTSALNPTLTPRACSKRKVITTPITEPSKKLKTTIQSKCSKSGMPKLNISKSRRLSKSRRERRRQRLSFKSSMNSNKENHDVTASTSYNDFEKEVSTRNNCRSTGIVLREFNQITVAVPQISKKTAEPSGNFLTPRGVTSCLQKTPPPMQRGVKKH